MKTTVKLLGIFAVLFLLVLSLASCGACKHKETEWIITEEATCSVAGTKEMTCLDCGEVVKTEQYDTDHTYIEGYCTYCGRAKYGSEYLVYEEITLDGEEGYELVGIGNSTAIELEIPALRNGKPVLSVAAHAFADNKNIVSVSFGKNVQQIGEGAFDSCILLETVTFPENSELKAIGGAAFAGCVSLEGFAFPAGVSDIPKMLFEGCTSLTTVTLHDGIFSLGEGAFADCDAIEYVELGGAKYLGTTQNPHLLLAGVLDKTITSFTVPDDTRIIGAEVFSGCASLDTVTLPEGVLSLGSYAFAGCASLSAITLPTTLQKIESYAFAECASLSSVTIPTNTLHIGERAFYKCSDLSAIQLPNGIRTVGALAFYNTSLSFTESSGGLYLGNTENPHLVLVGVAENITALTIHQSTRVVADSALSENPNAAVLTTLHVGANVVSIGVRALDGCTALTSVTFATVEGWCGSEIYGEAGAAITVTDPTANATALTGLYKYHYWYR